MSVLTTIGNAPGLEVYLDELEDRLEASVRSHPGVVSAVSADALAGWTDCVALAAVGTRGARELIRARWCAAGRQEGVDFWCAA